jgi:hypothetical protein
MAEFKHACFISYKHPPEAADPIKHVWIEFVEALQQRLTACLTRNRSVYRDGVLKTLPGVRYPTELSRNLCSSACLVAVLVPEYQESSWCMAEWRAMEKLEKQREEQGASVELLIPVLFRGDPLKAKAFAGKRTLVDLRHVYSPHQLAGVKNRRLLEHIAARIDGIVGQLGKPIQDCTDFSIMSEPEVVVPTSDDADPFA